MQNKKKWRKQPWIGVASMTSHQLSLLSHKKLLTPRLTDLIHKIKEVTTQQRRKEKLKTRISKVGQMLPLAIMPYHPRWLNPIRNRIKTRKSFKMKQYCQLMNQNKMHPRNKINKRITRIEKERKKKTIRPRKISLVILGKLRPKMFLVVKIMDLRASHRTRTKPRYLPVQTIWVRQKSWRKRTQIGWLAARPVL